MTQAKILVAGEQEQLCILSGIIDGLEALIKHTKLTKWNTAFTQCHNVLEAIMQERFLYFKDSGALKRLGDLVDHVKIGYSVANKDLTRDGEDTYKCKVAADDIYDMAAMLQEQNCQTCNKNKSHCRIYEIFRKCNIEKFDEHPPKVICPYSVILCEESSND